MSKTTIINPNKPKAASRIVKAQLREDLCSVSFIKADGSKRKMLGTLHPSFLPPYVGGRGNFKLKEPPEGLVVLWDVEKQAFRSMRVERLVSLKTVG